MHNSYSLLKNPRPLLWCAMVDPTYGDPRSQFGGLGALKAQIPTLIELAVPSKWLLGGFSTGCPSYPAPCSWNRTLSCAL